MPLARIRIENKAHRRLSMAIISVLVLLHLAKAAAFIAAGQGRLQGDSVVYWLLGERVAAGDWLLLRDSSEIVRTPAYPYYVAFFQATCGASAGGGDRRATTAVVGQRGRGCVDVLAADRKTKFRPCLPGTCTCVFFLLLSGRQPAQRHLALLPAHTQHRAGRRLAAGAFAVEGHCLRIGHGVGGPYQAGGAVRRTDCVRMDALRPPEATIVAQAGRRLRVSSRHSAGPGNAVAGEERGSIRDNHSCRRLVDALSGGRVSKATRTMPSIPRFPLPMDRQRGPFSKPPQPSTRTIRGGLPKNWSDKATLKPTWTT